MSDDPIEPIYQKLEANCPSEAARKVTQNVSVLQILLLIMLFTCLIPPLASCMRNSNFRPDDFPIYDNAQVLSRTVSKDIHPPTAQMNFIVLLTADEPEAVKTFYVEKLTKMGWSLSQETLPSDRLTIGIGNTCPWYKVNITTKRQDDGMTRVEIELYENLCA